MVFEKREIYFNFSMCTSTSTRYLIYLHIRELFNLVVPGTGTTVFEGEKEEEEVICLLNCSKI